MNGLTAANVEHLTEAINRSIDRYKASGKKETARALEDLLCAINEMRRYNATQPSRPDRVGDECWYFSNMAWRRGILRAWVSGEDYAAIEAFDTKKIICSYNISFSDKAPSE